MPKEKETGLLIIRYLGNNIEARQYELHKELSPSAPLSYRNVLRQLHFLRDVCLVELSKQERSKKQGKEQNFWRLTLPGLLFSFAYLPESDFERILTSHNYFMPLISSKWSFFKKNNIDYYVKKIIIQKSRQFFSFPIYSQKFQGDAFGYLWSINSKSKNVATSEIDAAKVILNFTSKQFVEDELVKALFTSSISYSDIEQEHFLSIAKIDKDLREIIENEFTKLEKEYTLSLQKIEQKHIIWKSLPNK